MNPSVEQWLKNAIADAERRRLPGLGPLLEGLAQATNVLREAMPGGRADGSANR